MMFRNNWWGYGNGWEVWVMTVLMIVVVVAIVVAAIYLIRGAGSRGTAVHGPYASPPVAPPGPQGGPGSPQDILKRRYAAGEIDRDEYLQKLEDLEKH